MICALGKLQGACSVLSAGLLPFFRRPLPRRTRTRAVPKVFPHAAPHCHKIQQHGIYHRDLRLGSVGLDTKAAQSDARTAGGRKKTNRSVNSFHMIGHKCSYHIAQYLEHSRYIINRKIALQHTHVAMNMICALGKPQRACSVPSAGLLPFFRRPLPRRTGTRAVRKVFPHAALHCHKIQQNGTYPRDLRLGSGGLDSKVAQSDVRTAGGRKKTRRPAPLADSI
jgi:hypothetical protein